MLEVMCVNLEQRTENLCLQAVRIRALPVAVYSVGCGGSCRQAIWLLKTVFVDIYLYS